MNSTANKGQRSCNITPLKLHFLMRNFYLIISVFQSCTVWKLQIMGCQWSQISLDKSLLKIIIIFKIHKVFFFFSKKIESTWTVWTMWVQINNPHFKIKCHPLRFMLVFHEFCLWLADLFQDSWLADSKTWMFESPGPEISRSRFSLCSFNRNSITCSFLFKD